MTRSRLAGGVLTVAALVLVLLVTVDLLGPSTLPRARVATALVRNGTVRVIAKATGTLVPVNQQNASFRQAGQLIEVDARVGDHVQSGQVLARIDPGPLQDALRQAQARQQSDQATLNNTLDGNAVQTARHNLDAAQTALQHIVAETTLAVQEDAATVVQDQRFLATDQLQLRRDQTALNRDQSTFNRDQARMNADLGVFQQDQGRLAAANAQLAGDQGKQQHDQSQLQRDQGAQQHDCPMAPGGAQCGSDRSRVSQDQNQVNQDQDRVSQDQRQVALIQGQVNQDSARLQADQSAIATDQPRVQQDQTLAVQDAQRVQADQGKLLADQEKGSADQVGGPKEVAQAQAAVTAAQDGLNQQTTNRANTIAMEQAVVAGDQAQVNTAQQNLAETVLTAPADGTVASVNGAVGESVTANGGATTPQAPGSVAPQPNAGAGPTAGGGAVPATGGAAASSAFIVLSDVNSLQVVAMIGEQDAARMEPNQTAMVSVDALPGVRLAAAVLAVGPNGTVLQNVTNYMATLVLQDTDRRLKAGMTASAAVVVTELRDVLVVPNAAIQRTGAGGYVTVVQSDGTERRAAIQTGQVGDTTTEVTAGLRPGDRVLLPQPAPAPGNVE